MRVMIRVARRWIEQFNGSEMRWCKFFVRTAASNDVVAMSFADLEASHHSMCPKARQAHLENWDGLIANFDSPIPLSTRQRAMSGSSICDGKK